MALGARPDTGEGMASGDVVNTASRLQAAAPENGILVDGATFRATRQLIDYGEAEPIEAKGKAKPIPVWNVLEARSRFGVDVVEQPDDAAGRPRTGARDRRRRARARPRGAGAATRHARRRPGDRQVPAGRGALPRRRRGLRADPVAPGTVVAVRGRHRLLGARRDGEGAGGDPRVGLRRRSGCEARSCGARPADGSGGLDRGAPAPARRARRRAARGPPSRGVRGLAGVLRGPGGAGPARARVRGHPVGGRRAPRLRRSPRGLDERRAVARRLHRTTRAARTPCGLGWGQAECRDGLACPRSRRRRPRGSSTRCSSARSYQPSCR